MALLRLFSSVFALLAMAQPLAGCSSDSAHPGSRPGAEAPKFALTELPKLQVQPKIVAFSNGVPVGTTSTQTVVATQTATTPLTVSRIELLVEGASAWGPSPNQTELQMIRAYGLVAGEEVWAVVGRPLIFAEPVSVGPAGSGAAVEAVAVEIEYVRVEGDHELEATLRFHTDSELTPIVDVPVVVPDAKRRLSVSPSAIDFGNAGDNSAPTSRTVGLTNIGSAPISISALEITGSTAFALERPAALGAPPRQSALPPFPWVLQAGESTTVQVWFAPQSPDQHHGALLVHSNAEPFGADRHSVELRGEKPKACLQLQPALVHVGSVVVGKSATAEFTAYNCGDTEARAQHIDWVTANPHFEIEHIEPLDSARWLDETSEWHIPAGSSLKIAVRYTPTSASISQPALAEPAVELAEFGVWSDATPELLVGKVVGSGAAPDCPTPVITIAEGEEVIPQSLLHLSALQSTSPNGAVVEYAWSVNQPPGSNSLFLPTPFVPEPQFEANAAGLYTFSLHVRDEQNQWSCAPTEATVAVIPDHAIHVQLVWHTPADPDETDEGPGAGSDLDLHVVHPYAGGPDLDGDGKPDGWFDIPFDTFWFNPAPDWPVAVHEWWQAEHPSLDRDDTDGAGPENFNLEFPGIGNTYRVGVHYWDSHGHGVAFATARVYLYGELAFEAGPVQLHELDMWEVCELQVSSNKIGIYPVLSKSGAMKITPNYKNPLF